VKNHAAAAHCFDNSVCDAQGVSLGSTAKTSATVSTVALSAGGGLLVTGVVLYLTTPKQPTEPAAGSSSTPSQRAPLPGALRLAATAAGASLGWEGTF
jgi:hypothetical protein